MKYIVLIMVCISFEGCQSRLMVREEAEELSDALRALNKPEFLRRRHSATTAVRKRINKNAPWLHTPLRAQYKNLPAREAINAVLGDRLAVFHLNNAETAIDSNPIVHSAVNAKTIVDHLDAIASQSNWGYEIKKGIVHWSDLPTRVFQLNGLQGERIARLGRGGSENSNASADDQYNFLQYKIDFWKEFKENLSGLLGDYHFTLLPSVNSITVTAPMNVLRRVESLVDRFNESSSKRVLVELEIYLVDLSDSEQEVLDWSFVKEAALGTVFNIGRDATGLVNGSNPFKIDLSNLSNDKYNGTRFIFNALAAQGATTVVSHPKVICLNNQVSEIRFTRVVPYVSEISFATEQGANFSRVTPNVNTEEVITGTTIFVLPTINGNLVNLSLSVNYTQVNRFLNQTFNQSGNGINIQLPEYDDTHFTLPVSLNSGETMVLAGNPRSVSDSQADGHRWSWLGHSKRSNKRTTETVMLLTVHVLDPT